MNKEPIRLSQDELIKEMIEYMRTVKKNGSSKKISMFTSNLVNHIRGGLKDFGDPDQQIAFKQFLNTIEKLPPGLADKFLEKITLESQSYIKKKGNPQKNLKYLKDYIKQAKEEKGPLNFESRRKIISRITPPSEVPPPRPPKKQVPSPPESGTDSGTENEKEPNKVSPAVLSNSVRERLEKDKTDIQSLLDRLKKTQTLPDYDPTLVGGIKSRITSQGKLNSYIFPEVISEKTENETYSRRTRRQERPTRHLIPAATARIRTLTQSPLTRTSCRQKDLSQQP